MRYLLEPPLEAHEAQTGLELGGVGDVGARRLQTLVRLLADRARTVSLELAEDFDRAVAAGADFDAALNSVAVGGWHANACHCMYVMAQVCPPASHSLLHTGVGGSFPIRTD
eukprot:COSAG01_NODE_5534_length_4201_cov_48.592150_3_plen_112_part_00